MTEGLIKVSELSGLMNAVTTDTNQTITGNKTFSGTTSAVTQTAGTNNTTVATTAFVKTAIDNVDALPSQTSQSGKFLTTNGTTASWANVDALPSQTSQSGKYLTTNGTTSSWSNVEGVVNKNGNPSMVYNWVGTYADYVAGRQNGTILDNWLCYVTDDVGGGLTVYTKTEIDNLFNAIEPPGSIKIWAGTTIPSGYLLCDGSAISRTEYSALFSAIGTTYGAGDSSSTFNLPDFRGRYLKLGTPGNYGSESLPNIVGHFYATNRYVPNDAINASGTFTYNGISADEYGTLFYNDTQVKLSTIWFNANLANSVYQNNAKVNPDNAEILYVIKY